MLIQKCMICGSDLPVYEDEVDFGNRLCGNKVFSPIETIIACCIECGTEYKIRGSKRLLDKIKRVEKSSGK